MKQHLNTYLKPFLIGIFAVFSPYVLLIVAAWSLVVTNIVTNLVMGWQRGEPIDKVGLKNASLSALAYLVIVVVATLLEVFVIGDSMPIAKIAASIIAANELHSIIKNFRPEAAKDDEQHKA